MRVGLVNNGEYLLGFNRLARRYFDFFYGSGCRGDNGDFHFHRFHDDDDFVFFNVFADLFFYFENFSNHGGFDVRGQDIFSFCDELKRNN